MRSMAAGKIIDGKAYAARLTGRIATAVKEIKAGSSLTPGLAVVLVGGDPASRIYVRRKAKQAGVAGDRKAHV